MGIRQVHQSLASLAKESFSGNLGATA